MGVEDQLTSWAKAVAMRAQSVPLQRAFDAYMLDLAPLLDLGIPHQRLADALTDAGVEHNNRSVSAKYVGSMIRRSKEHFIENRHTNTLHREAVSIAIQTVQSYQITNLEQIDGYELISPEVFSDTVIKICEDDENDVDKVERDVRMIMNAFMLNAARAGKRKK